MSRYHQLDATRKLVADVRLGQHGYREAIHFYKRLLPLLEFGRERETVDLSKVVLTHHTLPSSGPQPLTLGGDGEYTLAPIDAAGSGRVQEKEQAYLAEIIEKVNGLFDGQLSDEDQLVYVKGVLKGKLWRTRR